MLKMVDGTGIIGVDMVCPLGATVSPPQPPNYDMVEMEGVGSLMLPNSLKAPLERVELIGNSVQLTTTGKNIFDESKAVTGRINPDNGELLPETSYISSDYIEVQEGETYFQSGSGDGYYRAFYDMNKKFTSIPTKGVFKITVPVGSKFLRISGRKERFGDWMIEKGDKATPYEPYTGGKPSPSTEYPQEIKSAGIKSRNLFNKSELQEIEGFQIESETIIQTNYNIQIGKTLKQLCPNITPGKYYLSVSHLDDNSFTGIFGLKSGAWYKNSAKDLTEEDLNVNLGFVGSANGTCMYKLQIEEGDKATKYTTYTDKYLIDVKVTGKNLLNLQKEPDVKGTYLGWKLGDGRKMALSVKDKGNNADITGCFLGLSRTGDSSDGVAWVVHNGTVIIKELTNTCQYVSVYPPNKTTVQKLLDRFDIQLEFANNATNYEPYTEQILTLTSDRPITKWDKLVEQGGQYGWLYQSASDTDVKPSRLDLFPNGFSLLKDFGNSVYVYKVTNIKKAIGFQTSLCEQFKNKDGSYSTGDLFCYSDQPSMQMQYFVTDIPALEEFKTWMEANPLTMVYKTTQAEFIPLPESEQTQLRNLHSYNGTTNITVDSGEVPCGIKLTYRKEI